MKSLSAAVFAAFLAMSLLAACGDEEFCAPGETLLVTEDGWECIPTDETSTDECRLTSDCDSGETCIDGQCRRGNCVEDRDCPLGEVCEQNFCVANPGDLSCARHSDCFNDEVCINGVCRPGNCVEDRDCPLGEVCEQNFCSGTGDICWDWDSAPNDGVERGTCHDFGASYVSPELWFKSDFPNQPPPCKTSPGSGLAIKYPKVIQCCTPDWSSGDFFVHRQCVGLVSYFAYNTQPPSTPPATTCPATPCAAGYTCQNGTCVVNSTPPVTTCPSTPCASGYTCQSGVCVAPSAKQVTIKACWASAEAGWLAHFSWDYPNLPWKLEWKAWNLPLDASGCTSYLLPAGISQVNVDGSWKPVVQGGDGWFGEALAPSTVQLDGVTKPIPKYGYNWKGEGIGYPFFIDPD